MQVDSHQHFWTLTRSDYGWLKPESGTIYRDFLPGDLHPLLRETGMRRTVVVQAAPTVDETRYLLDTARNESCVAGVVGWVDMDIPDRAVEDLKELAGDGLLCGIRPMIQDVGDTHWILGSAPAIVCEELIELGLTFDALIRPPHLPVILELLTRYPEMKTVVDHGAKPDVAGRRWQPWADQIAAVAERTNACCKLSGLLTEARKADGEDELHPYLHHLYQCFGPDRLMWGSDWPVVNLADSEESLQFSGAREHQGEWGTVVCHRQASTSPYVRWHTMVQHWLRSKGSAAKDAIGGGTAIRFYGLRNLGRDG